MYQVFKEGRSSIRRKFSNYEAARQAVRKLVRAQADGFDRLFFRSNPPIGDFGYSIKKVAPSNDLFWF